MRLGLRMISGLGQAHAMAIEARLDGPFHSLAEFAHRTQLSPAVVERLAAADAFASLDLDRRHWLWQALAQEKAVKRCRSLLLATTTNRPLPCR